MLRNYHDWNAINEAYENGLVALCRAYSSESNVQPALAQKMGGTDVNYKYTFMLKSIEHVTYLARALSAAKAEQITDPNQNDILNINGKEVVEKGSILLTKSELSGNIQITASNNGLLTLFRLGDCFNSMKQQGVPSISQASDYAIKLDIGNPTQADDARGYAFAAINPNKAMSTANGIASALMLLISDAAGINPARVDMESQIVYPLYKLFIEPFKASNNYKGALEAIARSYAQGLQKRNFLVATEFIVPLDNFQDAVTFMESYLKRNYEGGQLLYLPSDVHKAAAGVMADIATAIAYGGAEGDFNMKALNLAQSIGFDQTVTPIISKYAGSLRNMLANGDLKSGFDHLQKASRKQPGKSAPTSVGQKSVATSSQGEGEFGN